jgi:hypothetical protein
MARDGENGRLTRSIGCVFVAFCCACANGYDGSLIGSITVMPYFKATMHSENTGWQVSVMSSLYSV